MPIQTTRTQLDARINQLLAFIDDDSFDLHTDDLPRRLDVARSLAMSRVVSSLPTDSLGGDFAILSDELYFHNGTQYIKVLPEDLLVYKGQYRDNTAYKIGNVVDHASSLWMCKIAVSASNTTAPDAVGNTSWTQFGGGGDVPQPSDTAPVIASGSVGAAGANDNYERAGHRHPVNTLSQLRNKTGVVALTWLTSALQATINSALQLSDFQPSGTTVWSTYFNDFQSWSGTAIGFQFFTGTPSDTTKIEFPDLTTKSITSVTRMRIRKTVRSDPDVFGVATEQMPQPLSGAVLNATKYDANAPVATFTLSADAISGGTGASAYWDCTGVMTQSANWNPGGTGYCAIDNNEPTQIRLPEEAIQVNGSLFQRFFALGDIFEDLVMAADARFLIRNPASPSLQTILTAYRMKLMEGAAAASDPIAETVPFIIEEGGVLKEISLSHARKHIVPGTNEFAGFVLGNGDAVGEAALTGIGNQLTLGVGASNKTDIQLDIKPDTLIALQRVSNPAQYHLGLVSTNTPNSLGGVDYQVINFVAGEFRTVGTYDFSAIGNYGEAVKVVAFGDKIRWKDIVQIIDDSTPSHIKVASEKAIRDAIDEGDQLAHNDIGLVAELLDQFYEGWTSVSGANYSNETTIVANLPVDAFSDSDQVVPTTTSRVILRSSTWSDAPGNAIWGLDFLSGTDRYFVGINAGGNDQFVYKRNGTDWNKLWEDGTYESGAASDPVFMTHWYDVVDGDIKLADSLETRRHQWSIPGVSASNMALYRRDGRDVAAMIPNYGGSAIIDYSWNYFSVEAEYVTVDATGFDGNLATTDNDVQKVAQKVDDLTIPAGVTKLADIGTITGTYSNIATGLSADDIISIAGRCQWTSQTNNFYFFNFGPMRFGDIVTSDDTWVTVRGSGSGQRLHVRRNSDDLQMRNANAIQNVTGAVYKWN